jgi:hypothetical protein
MKLLFTNKIEWPKLAWVAKCERDEVNVFHGSGVEISNDWCFEGVWQGDFQKGDFDLTDNVYGTGVRLRDNVVSFVTPIHDLDRLYYTDINPQIHYVSNTLPGLLALSGLELSNSINYANVLTSFYYFYKKPLTIMPTRSGNNIHLLYYNNIQYDGDSLNEKEKTNCTPHFSDYKAYYDYLNEVLHHIGDNAKSELRKNRIELITTLSQGYDSSAVSALAKKINCTEGISFVDGNTSFSTKCDSGKEVGNVLGINVIELENKRQYYRDEELIWAANGLSGQLPLTVYDWPSDKITLLFTGQYGGIVWNSSKHDPEHLLRGSPAGSGIAEYRLHKGIIHCPFAFTGKIYAKEIEDITFSDEMNPWKLNRDHYNRPIPRRILEDQGVDRNAFGITKAIIGPWVVFWPTDKNKKNDLKQYLKNNNFSIPLTWGRYQAFIDRLITQLHAVSKKLFGSSILKNNYRNHPQNGHLMWSIEKIKKYYSI